MCGVCAESRELYSPGNYVEMGGRSDHLNLFNDSSLSDISFKSRFDKNDMKNRRNVDNLQGDNVMHLLIMPINRQKYVNQGYFMEDVYTSSIKEL